MEIYIYESASSCAIDALIILSKSDKGQPIRAINDSEVNSLCQSMKNGEATREDFEDVSSDSVIWSAIVKLCSQSKIFAGKEDVNIYTTKLPGHIQRFLGALLGTLDILVEKNESDMTYLIESLYEILFAGSPEPELLISILQDYRSLFPYSYMFYRRVGRTPKQQTSAIISILQMRVNPKPSKTDILMHTDSDISSYVAEGVTRSNSLSKTNNRSASSNVWNFNEDEDSDGVDNVPNYRKVNKKNTRLRNSKPDVKSNISPTSQTLSAGISKPLTKSAHSPLEPDDDDDDISEIDASVPTATNKPKLTGTINKNDVVKFEDIPDIDQTPPPKPVRNRPANLPKPMSPLSDSEDKMLDGIGNITSAGGFFGSGKEEVTLEDLRSTYNSIAALNSNAIIGAEKVALSRDIRLKLASPSLADDILGMIGSHISWEDLLNSSKKYLKRTIRSASPSSDVSAYKSEDELSPQSLKANTGKTNLRHLETHPKSPANSALTRFAATSPASASRQRYRQKSPSAIKDDDSSDSDEGSETNLSRQAVNKHLSSASPRQRHSNNQPISVTKSRSVQLGVKEGSLFSNKQDIQSLRDSIQNEKWLESTSPKNSTEQALTVAAVTAASSQASTSLSLHNPNQTEIQHKKPERDSPKPFSFITEEVEDTYESSEAPTTARSILQGGKSPSDDPKNPGADKRSPAKPNRLPGVGVANTGVDDYGWYETHSHKSGNASPASDDARDNQQNMKESLSIVPGTTGGKTDSGLASAKKRLSKNQSFESSFYLSDSSMDDSFYAAGNSASNSMNKLYPPAGPISSTISTLPLPIKDEGIVKNRIPIQTIKSIQSTSSIQSMNSDGLQWKNQQSGTPPPSPDKMQNASQAHSQATNLTPASHGQGHISSTPIQKVSIGISPARANEEYGMNDSFSDGHKSSATINNAVEQRVDSNENPITSNIPFNSHDRQDEPGLLQKQLSSSSNSAYSHYDSTLPNPIRSASPKNSNSIRNFSYDSTSSNIPNTGGLGVAMGIASYRASHGEFRQSQDSVVHEVKREEPPRIPLTQLQESIHAGFKAEFSPPPLSEFACKTGILFESWLEKKSKRTGFWNKKYYVLCEAPSSSSDVCLLKVYRKAVESTWGMVHLDMSSLISVASIDSIKLVNAKSGRDFEVTLRPRSGNLANDNRASIDSSGTVGQANINANRDSVNRSNNQRPSTWNVWNDSASVNSDAKENAQGGIVMTLRAEDAQTRLLWITFLQRALSVTIDQQNQAT